MFIIDIMTLLGGVLLVVAPEWCYNAGRKGNPQPVPENWPRNGRIIGVVFLVIGGFFLYNTITTGGLGF